MILHRYYIFVGTQYLLYAREQKKTTRYGVGRNLKSLL